VLKLRPLPGLEYDPGPREIGDAMHEVLEEFVRLYPSGPLPEKAREMLVASSREKLEKFADDAEFQSFRWPRLVRGLEAYLAFEAKRRAHIEKIVVETGGNLTIRLADGSTFA